MDLFETDLPLDYGHAVLLRHEPDGLAFYSLWGHLSAQTVRDRKVGERLKAGDVIGQLGGPHENGNWQPHVHIQLITYQPDHAGDVIGAGEASYRAVWGEVFPDPMQFVGLPPETMHAGGKAKDALLTARKSKLIRNLSISYRKPLKIVRGDGVWLIDETGRAYLDCYNNVAQLGHSNPEIVETIARQAAILNTNTRYLHDNVIAYAEALTATLPAKLKVAAFCCTGSEANDLALAHGAQPHQGEGRDHARLGLSRAHPGPDRDQPVQIQAQGRQGSARNDLGSAVAGCLSRARGLAESGDRAALRPAGHGDRFGAGEGGPGPCRLHRGIAAELGRADRAAGRILASGSRGGTRRRRGGDRGRSADRLRPRRQPSVGVRDPGCDAGHHHHGQADRKRAPDGRAGDDRGDRRELRQRHGVFQHLRRQSGVLRGRD